MAVLSDSDCECNNNDDNKNSWIRKYNLYNNDKNLIENSSGWLNDKIINVAQSLLKTYSKSNGMQDTLFIPTFCEANGTWTLNDNWKRQIAPASQIHYNGSHHWLISYQNFENGPIYVLDSIKSSRSINTSMSVRLAQLYSSNSRSLDILIPDIQRQTNSSDCGVFSIAYLAELIFNDFNVGISKIRFDIPLMRSHLLNCFVNDKILPFPKVLKMPKMPTNDICL